jgi:hypothetical protein
MINQFLRIAGVNNENEFYSKYPTEDAFFNQHPEAKLLTQSYQVGGATYNPMQTGMSATGAQPSQDITPEKIIMAYAKATKQKPESIIGQLKKLQPQEQQKAIMQMYGVLTGQTSSQQQADPAESMAQQAMPDQSMAMAMNGGNMYAQGGYVYKGLPFRHYAEPIAYQEGGLSTYSNDISIPAMPIHHYELPKFVNGKLKKYQGDDGTGLVIPFNMQKYDPNTDFPTLDDQESKDYNQDMYQQNNYQNWISNPQNEMATSSWAQPFQQKFGLNPTYDPNKKYSKYKQPTITKKSKSTDPFNVNPAAQAALGLMGAVGYNMRFNDDQNRLDAYKTKIGGTDARDSMPNVYSHGRNTVNEDFYSSPGSMAPMQFSGMQQREYYGYPQMPGRRRYAQGGDVNLTTDLLGLLDLDPQLMSFNDAAPTGMSDLPATSSSRTAPTPVAPEPSSSSTESSKFSEAAAPDDIVDVTGKLKDKFNYNWGKYKAQPEAFVIHHTGGRGGIDGVINTFKERGLAAHYVIDRTGKIFKTLNDDEVGAQTRKGQGAGKTLSNFNTMGVEVIAKDDTDILPNQIQAAAKLAKYLGFGKDQVFGHGEINRHKMKTEGKTITNFIRQNFKEGGEYELTDDEIAYIMANGGEIQFL